MTDPTPAEIEAGAAAIRNWRYIPDAGDGCPSVRMGSGADLAEVVLRAVLPDHDTRLRADGIRAFAAHLRGVAQRGGSDRITAVVLDVAAIAEREADRIARGHTTDDRSSE